MAFEFSEGKPVETPTARQKKSTLGKIGEFIAPSTTEVVRDIGSGEAPSLREIGGSALEIGSFLIPAGAIARGFGALGRGAKAISGAKKVATGAKATKALPKKPQELERLQSGIKEFGTRTAQQAKRGAQVGGVSGAMFGAGTALGDEEKSFTEVLGQGAVGGALGAVGSGLLTPLTSIGAQTTKAVTKAPIQAFRRAQETLNPTQRAKTVDDLTQALRSSFVEDRPAVLNRLEKILDTSARREGREFTEDTLLREVIDAGYIPKVDGSVARFKEPLQDATSRISKLSEGVEELAKGVRQKTPLSSIRKEAQEELLNRTDVDLDKASRQLNQIFKALERKYGKSLDAVSVNKIRKEMNQRTRSFNKETFIMDTATAVANATRQRLDNLVPQARQLNAEAGKLFRIKETMSALNNKRIDVGPITSGLGRFLGVTGAAAGGLSVAGPGGLVVAGIMAQLGSRGLANLIRQARFNPQAQAILRRGIRSDEKLLKQVLKNAKPSDKALIERVAGTKTRPTNKPQSLKRAPRIQAPKKRR